VSAREKKRKEEKKEKKKKEKEKKKNNHIALASFFRLALTLNNLGEH